jgi:glutamate dehydrogenase (NAD(P)+)
VRYLDPRGAADVIHAGNVKRLRTKLVAQGANIPRTEEAEAALAERGVLILPDFIANAGGVICAAAEYQGGSEAAAFAAIDEKIRANTSAVLDRASSTKVLPRAAAVELVKTRVSHAMRTRRWEH